MSGMPIPANIAGAILTIDLNAIQKNYQILLDRLNGIPLAAVVKADAYGLGARQIGRTLARRLSDVIPPRPKHEYAYQVKIDKL